MTNHREIIDWLFTSVGEKLVDELWDLLVTKELWDLYELPNVQFQLPSWTEVPTQILSFKRKGKGE